MMADELTCPKCGEPVKENSKYVLTRFECGTVGSEKGLSSFGELGYFAQSHMCERLEAANARIAELTETLELASTAMNIALRGNGPEMRQRDSLQTGYEYVRAALAQKEEAK